MLKQISSILLVSAVLLSACNEEQDIAPAPVSDNTNLTLSEDITNLEYVTNDIEVLVDDLVETRDPGDCLEINFKQPRGTFPNTITLQFDGSCEGPNGHMRSGKITVVQSASLREAGATRTTTFENFTVDNLEYSGTKTLTNSSVDAEGNITLERTASISLLFPNGNTATWDVSYTIEQIAGGETDAKLDDVFEITGEASGVGRNGVEWSAVITEPLVRRRDCRWLTAGVITYEFSFEGETRTRSIDFGHPSGECDNLALVTLNDSSEKEIRIFRRWW